MYIIFVYHTSILQFFYLFYLIFFFRIFVR